MDDVKFIEVDGQKFVDDGEGNPKNDEFGNPIPFVEEKTVPYERFKEVNSKMRELEQQISSLKKEETKGNLSPEQEKELQAKQYLKTLLKETLEEGEKEKAEREKQEQDNFEKAVDDSLVLFPDVKKDEFLKFIEEKGNKYGVQSVSGAMTLYRDINNLSKEITEKTKKEVLGKPKLPTHEGGSSSKYDVSGKSLSQIADEAIRELK